MQKRESSLDRVLGRIDTLDTVNLANLAQRLARERSLLETVFNTALEGMMVIDEDGIVHFANAASRKMIGLKESDVGKAQLWRLIPGLQASLGLKEGASLDSSISSRELELNYPERRFVRLYILPFSDEAEDGGEPTRRFVAMMSDITREKLSNEELIESEKVSSILLLAAGVAHELGNPLNSITIHLQLLERQIAKLKATPDSGKMERSIHVCGEEVKRLDGIISNFLEAIRPQDPDFQVLNLHEPLEEVLEFQAKELSNRGIQVEVELGSEKPVALADKNQMKQVFFNVIKNAMEAMSPGGSLRIGHAADEEKLYIKFADTGVGIRQEDLTRVFQPYHTTKKGGTGLGMMIVQRIIREHGGQIGIDSREGAGTVVTLEIPKHARKIRMIEG